MRKLCAGVGEEVVQQVHDFALKMSATLSSSPGGGSHGPVITKMCQWVKDEKLADQVSDACLVEIVRLARAKNLKEQKTKQDAEAKAAQSKREAEQLSIWKSFSDTEKRWVILAERVRAESKSDPAWSYKMAAPIIQCEIGAIQLGQMGIITEPIIVTNITSSSSAIGELRCAQDLNAILTMIGKPADRPHSIGVWISGVDTSKLTTGSEWDLIDRPFEVVGTKTYSTAVGSNRTVFDLQLLPIDPHKLGNVRVPQGVTLQNYKEAEK